MTAVPPLPESAPTVHLPVQAQAITPSRVIPADAWSVRPGSPSTAEEPVSTPAASPVPEVATAAGGSGDWLWRLPPSPPVPPGGGGMAPWLPPQPPAPTQPQQIDIHVTIHQPVPVEPDLTWWQRLARAVPYRVSPLVAVTATAAAIVPLPHLGYGAGRVWGSLLHHIGADAHPAVSHVAAAVAVAVVAARIHRPCRLRTTLAGDLVRRLNWLDAFGVATTLIGGSWGVLVPDAVEFLTGVRA
ncbi:hypothetical protein CP981_20255 [Streptomyces platensis]|uniref:Uncharacterized protein n=1 Tax=Streptomyces platensis TaxID=58346 RepID=A0AAE6NKW9_STRPT|nr:hypothetical protein [Streptomyces platensis]OSY45768.1 hypothetical protein BG653_02793 [Streptomyces platensis]QEV53675.1 hypothetical protein CP981_20255 [Streptomyces platensis]